MRGWTGRADQRSRPLSAGLSRHVLPNVEKLFYEIALAIAGMLAVASSVVGHEASVLRGTARCPASIDSVDIFVLSVCI